MVPEDKITNRDHLWILELRDSTIRRMLRALRSGRRRDHPLLQARFLSVRVVAGAHSDSARVRWWLLDQYASGLITAKVATLRGPAQSLDRRVLRLQPPEAQVAAVLDAVCLEGGVHLQAWSALFARYFLAIPDNFDIAAAVGIHRRTFQRWLKVGYDLLRTAMSETELAVITRAAGLVEPLAGSSDSPRSSSAQSGRSSALGRARHRSGGTRATVDAGSNEPHDEFAGFWRQRIEAWAGAPYDLDSVFVRPRLRWTNSEPPKSPHSASATSGDSSLGELLEAVGHGVIVVLGPPGSGKTTLLRRHEVDVAHAGLAGRTDRVTLLAPLLGYSAVAADNRPAHPLSWLERLWQVRSNALPDLATLLASGRVDLLLDGLSELPHATAADFRTRTVAWRQLAGDIVAMNAGNRVVFTCRRHDYTVPHS